MRTENGTLSAEGVPFLVWAGISEIYMPVETLGAEPAPKAPIRLKLNENVWLGLGPRRSRYERMTLQH